MRPARRITGVLFAAQCLASAAFIATSTVAAIAGTLLSGERSLAGLPAAASTLAGSGAAFAWGLLMDRMGRRPALALGVSFGALGAAISVWGIASSSFLLFVAGMMLLGVAQAAVTLSRFVAAEVNTAARRGRAVSMVVLGGTVGAIGGPLLVGPSGNLAMKLSTSELAGAFGLAVLLLILAALVIGVFLRPEPRTLARSPHLATGAAAPPRPIPQIARIPAASAAIAAMVFSQVVMVGLMVITSLYMKDMHHDLGDISVVISAHTIGMYGFSLLSGWLIDHWGRRPVIVTGALVLVLACLTAPLTGNTMPISASLLLLGLGWNFCFVGGSTLLADHLTPAERGRTQGFNDLLVGVASALGSFGSGVVAASIGYSGVGLVGAAVALLPLILVMRWARQPVSQRPSAPAAP
ncbi:MAG TPA: MFS transporter [bacterium]|nr:MFS transporter [bacterium]